MAENTGKPNEGSELIANPQKAELFTIGGTLDVSDVLTVATSRAEAKLATKLAAAKKSLKEAEKAEKKAVAAFEEAAEAQSREICDSLAKGVEAGLEALGGCVVRNTAKDLVKQHDANRVHGRITLCRSKDGLSGYGCIIFERFAEPNEAVLEARSAAEHATEVREAAAEHALKVKRQLNNIPLLERQYRAKIAESKLQTSEEGKQLLEAMTSTLDDDILALPSH